MNNQLLIKELCRADHTLDIARYRRELAWIAKQRDEDLVAALLEYVDRYGKTPTMAHFREFLVTRPKSEGALGDLDAIAALTDAPTDLDQLVADHLHDCRHARFLADLKTAAGLSQGGGKRKKDGREIPIPATPAAALAYLNDRARFDYKDADHGLWLHDSDEILRQELARDPNADRITTGFRSIDNAIILSKKYNPFWVIPGFAHEGKSTVLTSLLYEFINQPLKIAYFSKEHESTELLTRMAFLHAYQFRERANWVLPSMNDWYAGKKDAEDLRRMKEIVDDLLTLPGKIVFHRLTNWDEAMAVLNADQYDVCAMDYLAIIDTPGVQERNKNEEIRRLCGEAQKLTRTYNDNAGLMFITPTQINRQGKKDSLKKEGTEKKYDLTAIAQHSSLYQDADFVWSLYSDDDMKAANTWLLEVHKVRMLAPQLYPVALLSKDYRTGYVTETTGRTPASPIKQGWINEEARKTELIEGLVEEFN